ncbi:ABC transporter substrate-binding protein [Pseudarthrobacter sp. LMD1-1-1.1]|uniref:ABC transporter substrate-binding protein n=1 Tax=Pseudarthrobacter sp. LMD1-1-1.1 TaxID=3135242 RepID=UPI00342AF43C
MRKQFTAAILALGLTASLAGCASDEGAASAGDTSTGQLLPMPVIDTSDGLRIDGELIADKGLYEAAKNDRVQLYSGIGKEAEDLTDARFLAETGIPVDLTRLGSNPLAERAQSEFSTGKLGAGVIRLTDVRLARNLADKNIYVPYRTPSYDKLQEDKAWVSDKFVNCYYLVKAMAYNSAVITQDQPTKWEDLTDPKYKGQLGETAITSGGSINALVHFLLSTFGPEFLQAEVANAPKVYDSTATQISALARGEISIAAVSFDNAFATEVSGAPIKIVVPEKGVSASAGVLGLTPTGEKSPAAQVFMNWTMSKSAQRFAAAQGFAPSRTDLDPVKTGQYQLPKANSPQFHLYTEDDFAKYADKDAALWKKTFSFMG